MTGRLGRWLACHPTVERFVDWTIMVRMEVAAESVDRRAGPDTVPTLHWIEPAVPAAEVVRLRAILDGVSPSDLPRGR